METTKFSSPKLPKSPFALVKPCHQRSTTIAAFNYRGTNGRDYESGRLVDENMIVLRQRIKEMKMLEACNNPPSHWMEWEKQYLEHYNYQNDVCEAIGLLQNYLINVRPSLALGMVLLVALSVPISSRVVLFQVIEIAKTILSGFHLS